VSPRALERSTGMPREATRSPAPRVSSAPIARAPAQGGGAGAQRSESGGSYRGNTGGGSAAGGGSYRGGGGSERGAHPAARSSGRSAAR
jgi:hypothetical protein